MESKIQGGVEGFVQFPNFILRDMLSTVCHNCDDHTCDDHTCDDHTCDDHTFISFVCPQFT